MAMLIGFALIDAMADLAAVGLDSDR